MSGAWSAAFPAPLLAARRPVGGVALSAIRRRAFRFCITDHSSPWVLIDPWSKARCLK